MPVGAPVRREPPRTPTCSHRRRWKVGARRLSTHAFSSIGFPATRRLRLSQCRTKSGSETRRVYGDYRLTREDVLAARQFDDQIGLCGAPIEDHHGRAGTGTTWEYLPDGSAVGIPLSTLIVRDAVNVLAAGRCFSATHDAQASVRSMAQCMAMGQGAGTTAALAVGSGGDVRRAPIQRIQDLLRNDGAILEVERP